MPRDPLTSDLLQIGVMMAPFDILKKISIVDFALAEVVSSGDSRGASYLRRALAKREVLICSSPFWSCRP